jgi:hypothetical protein
MIAPAGHPEDEHAARGRGRDRPHWFEPALPSALIAGVERRVAAPWRGAVPIIGASFDDLIKPLRA